MLKTYNGKKLLNIINSNDYDLIPSSNIATTTPFPVKPCSHTFWIFMVLLLEWLMLFCRMQCNKSAIALSYLLGTTGSSTKGQ